MKMSKRTPKPLNEGTSKGNTRIISNAGRQAPPPPPPRPKPDSTTKK